MAEVITKCSHCNAELQVQYEWVGMEVECPQCHEMFVIKEDDSQMQDEKPVICQNFQSVIEEFRSKMIIKVEQIFKAKLFWYIVVGIVVAGGIFGSVFYFCDITPQKQSALEKISVSVTVKQWMFNNDSVQYSCEYRLYADNQLIANRNSSRLSTTFSALKVEKGAQLRAEMLIKNGNGGIAQTLEGPSSYYKMTNITANHAGESLTVECCDFYGNQR